MSGNFTNLPTEGSHAYRLSIEHVVVAFYGVLLAALAMHFASYLRYTLAAIRYPFELDYGEGIVWQQAVLIPGKQMYGDITKFPFIVFHYPPLYHLTVHAIAAFGVDELVVGRGISVLCTLLIGVLVAALSFEVAGRDFKRASGLIGSLVAGLTVFCYWPVVDWSPMMRVDMLAIMLDFLGVWLAIRSFRRPWLLYLAVVSFVLAIYTKQTAISAPLSVMLVFLVTDRRRAFRAYGLGLLLGLAGLLVLTWMTAGGFLRHILLYNLNRFSLGAVGGALFQEWPQTIFLVAALTGLGIGWRGFMDRAGSAGRSRFVRCISQHMAARSMAILTFYLIFATGMLTTLGKSGAVLNYLIEWMCLLSVLIGILVTSTLSRIMAGEGSTDRTSAWRPGLVTALLVPAALLAQIIIMPATRDFSGGDAERDSQLHALVARIRDAPRPVLSDDMVLLMKAGKQVPWEPAIFAELASIGRWDQRLIVNMIATRAFSFIITKGHRGQRTYDDQFSSGVDQAIRKAYPRTEVLGGKTLHIPPA